MRPSTAIVAASGLGAVVSARAIPAADTEHAITFRTNTSGEPLIPSRGLPVPDPPR